MNKYLIKPVKSMKEQTHVLTFHTARKIQQEILHANAKKVTKTTYPMVMKSITTNANDIVHAIRFVHQALFVLS